jgi:hypothetical protein
MSTTTVVNLKNGKSGVLKIARPTKWGNPYCVEGMKSKYPCIYLPTLEEVLIEYEKYIRSRPDLIAALPELRGKRLGCWCAPEPCHGDVLIRLLDEYYPE